MMNLYLIPASIYSVLTGFATAQVQCNQGATCDTGLPTVATSNITFILQLVFGIIGVLAFLIIIISALRFVLSGGDPQSVATARNTIIYAVIGLVIAISAEVIVTYVLNHV